MRVVALEEHLIIPELSQAIDPAVAAGRGWPQPGSPQAASGPTARLIDTGPDRVADMDASGITLQVLSLAGPGADLVDGANGISLARAINDRLGQIVRERPDRYAAFAHLPMTTPAAAADELERTVQLGFKGAMVNGLTNDRFLDDPSFAPILAAAEALDVPIYLHPNLPPPAIHKIYYDGLPNGTGMLLARSAWGWHSEMAIHVLRLVLSGTFDRYPKLKLIVGHMGEGLPAMMERCDEVLSKLTPSYLSRTVSQTILDQTWITTSGFFALAPFTAAMMTFGADRILFSVDYPFSPNSAGRAFLDHLPVAPADKAKIAHGNADRLLKLDV